MIRVEVATHFDEDAFSYGLALGMAERLRERLRDVRCPDHEADGAVRLSTDGIAQTLNDLHVEVHGCCAEVVDRVREIIEQMRLEPAPPDGETNGTGDAG